MANIAPLIDSYKTLFTNYAENWSNKCKTIPQQLTEIQPSVQAVANNLVESLKTQLTDFSPVGTASALHTGCRNRPSLKFWGISDFGTLCDQYLGVAICLLIGSIGYILGGMVPFLVGIVFDSNWAFFTAIVFLPVGAYYLAMKTDMSKEDRFNMLVLTTLASSALIGFLYSMRYMTARPPPPLFMFPLALGFGSAVMGPKIGDQQRHIYIGALVGAAFGVCFLIGLVTGSVGGGFIMWSIVYAAAAFADYQLKVGRILDGSVGWASNMLISIEIYQVAGFLVMAILSGSSPPSESE
uniref:DUF4203 domain-containing protein n=1 Tax=Romanomermis culicivorax TaxID=13658 RepID=A0A915IKK3_ROMCU